MNELQQYINGVQKESCIMSPELADQENRSTRQIPRNSNLEKTIKQITQEECKHTSNNNNISKKKNTKHLKWRRKNIPLQTGFKIIITVDVKSTTNFAKGVLKWKVF